MIAATPGTVLVMAAGIATATTPMVVAIANATSTRAPYAEHGRWPWIALGLAGIAAVVTWQRGPAVTATCGPLLLVGGAAAVVDAREHRLPDPLTATLFLTTPLAVGVHSILNDDAPSLTRAAAGLLITFGVLVAGKILRPDAIGWGDIKLAPSLGAYLGWTGWHTIYTGILLWSALILITIAAVVARNRSSADNPIPYGPAMILGTVLVITLE